MGFLSEQIVTKQGLEVLSISSFIKKYHPTLSSQGVKAAIYSGKVDAIQPERDIFVVMTDQTKTYHPRPLKGVR